MEGHVNDGDLERVRSTKRKFGRGYGRSTEGVSVDRMREQGRLAERKPR